MADTDGSRQEISLGAGFDAVVRYGNTTIELHPGGDLTVKTKGDIDAYMSGAVHVHPAADEPGAVYAKEPKPGDKMRDGTIYAGSILSQSIALRANAVAAVQ